MNETEHEQQSIIDECKALLAQTDYKALKHADGAMTDEEYEPVRQLREECRAKINAAEAELADES